MSDAAPSHRRLATRDPLRARELLDETYGLRLSLKTVVEDGFTVTFAETRAGPMTLTHAHMPLDVAARVTGREEFVFATLRAGRATYDRGRDSQRLGPGDVSLAIRPREEGRTHIDHADVNTVSLPPWLLDEVVRRSLDETAATWTFTSLRPVTGGARQWRHISRLVEELLTDPEIVSTALTTGPAVRLLAATVLSIFPNTAVSSPARADRRDAQPDALRRAVAYIDANPDLDVTVADVAHAASVTVRTIQLAFRRHLDTTPTAYLRQVRLHHAHEQLREAAPGDGLTVTRIAVDWGFANPSRFAAHYRAAYGRPPGRTLAE